MDSQDKKDLPELTSFHPRTDDDTAYRKYSVNGDVDAKENESKDSITDKERSRQRVKNIMVMVLLTAVGFLSDNIFRDAKGQWLYMRFQERALGENFTLLNVSAIESPCLDTGNSSTNPFEDDLNRAQSMASKYDSFADLLQSIPSTIITLLLGPYSDRIGRKLFFLAPVCGNLINQIITWAVCNWHLQIELCLIGNAISGLSGSFSIMSIALYAYTADNTDPNSGRSFGMVVVWSIADIVPSLAHVAVGQAIAHFGYRWPMLIAWILTLLSAFGFIFFLKESLPEKDKKAPKESLLVGLKNMFTFNFQNTSNPECKRKDLIILIAVSLLLVPTWVGRIWTLYVLNEPFCWNSKVIGTFDTIQGFIGDIMSVVALRGMQRFLSDEVICVISLVSSAVKSLMMSVATKSWMIYLASAIGIIQFLSWGMMRALLSKMCPTDKQGTLLSSLSFLESVISTGTNLGNAQLYAHTVSIWKGLVYFVSGVITGICALILIGYTVMVKRRRAKLRAMQGDQKDAHVQGDDDVIEATEAGEDQDTDRA